MIVRRFAAAAAAVIALGALTACEKPAPQVTVYSSGRVINVDAARYCFDKCTDHETAMRTIRVRGNTDIGFDVPKRVAEKGWVLQVGNDVQFAEPRHESHFRLSVGTIAAKGKQPVPVTIVETGGGPEVPPTGLWRLQFSAQE